MKALEQILKDEGIAGSIVLHEPGFSEFLLHMAAPYSCAFIEGGQLRIRAKRADFPTLAAQKKKVTETINMIQHFKDNHEMLARVTGQMLTKLNQQFVIENEEGLSTSQQELDN